MTGKGNRKQLKGEVEGGVDLTPGLEQTLVFIAAMRRNAVCSQEQNGCTYSGVKQFLHAKYDKSESAVDCLY